MELAKVSTIAHFLSEIVSWIDLAHDVTNVKGLVLDPFMDGVFLELNVPGRFGCHIIRPFKAGLIVIIEDRGEIDI